MICNFSLSVAARTIVRADPFLRYESMLLGRYVTNVVYLKILEDTRRHLNMLEDTSRYLNTLEDTSRYLNTLEDTSRHLNTLEDTPRHLKIPEDTLLLFAGNSSLSLFSTVFVNHSLFCFVLFCFVVVAVVDDDVDVYTSCSLLSGRF